MSKRRIRVLAHNIRSLWNVGSLFRTADAMDVEKIYLTGYTALPPRREISKTAIGAEEWIAWEHAKNPFDVMTELQDKKWKIVALELTEEAVPLSSYTYSGDVCLVLGHEVTGVPEELLACCDETVYIPMHGKKESLNVAVATGIALDRLRN